MERALPTGSDTPPQGAFLKRTAAGATWMLTLRMVNRGLGFVSTLILVRLLTPDDFGLISLAFSFSTALTRFSMIGVEAQLIRSHAPTRELFDTGFTFNVLRGVLLGILIFAAAGPASAWFQDERLGRIFQVIASLPVLQGLLNVGMIYYKRNMDFTQEFIILSFNKLCQVLVTVLFAFILRNYISMLIGIVASRVLSLVLSYRLHPYRPRLSVAAWRELAGVSVWSWLINVAIVVRDRVDIFLIGRFLGATALGYYSVAVEIAGLAMTEIVSPLSHACLPGFAATLRSGDRGKIGPALVRTFGVVTLIAAPAGVGLSLVATPLVFAGFGQKWLSVADLIAVKAIPYIAAAVGLIANSFVTARAALRPLFVVTIVSGVLRVAGLIVIGVHYGLMGIAVLVSVLVVLEQLALILLSLSQAEVRVGTLLSAIWRPLVAAAVMALLLVAAGLGWERPAPAGVGEAMLQLAFAVALGTTAFTAALALLWWACGRPSGAETDLLGFVQGNLGAVLRRLKRRKVLP